MFLYRAIVPMSPMSTHCRLPVPGVVLPVRPLASVTVSETVNGPGVVYVCETGLPVPVFPSPKFHAYENVLVAPVGSEVDALKVNVPGPATCIPLVVGVPGGLEVNLVVRGRQFAGLALYNGLAQYGS
jgi:hypothetical protein